MERLFGGNPLGVVLRLVVLSIIVGVVLGALGIRPDELISGLQRIVRNIWAMGFDAFGAVGRYLAIGATVVIPVWIVVRLLGLMRSGGGGGSGKGDGKGSA